jgi:hypothetical protein
MCGVPCRLGPSPLSPVEYDPQSVRALAQCFFCNSVTVITPSRCSLHFGTSSAKTNCQRSSDKNLATAKSCVEGSANRLIMPRAEMLGEVGL